MFLKILQRNPGMTPGVFQMGSAQHAAKIAISFRIAGQQGEMITVRQGYLQPLNRFNPHFSAQGIELNRPTQVIVVSKSQGRHIQVLGPFNYTFYGTAPIQKGKSAMGMKVNKHPFTPF